MTFEDQIQFVYTGGVYYLYFYANNQWNSLYMRAASAASTFKSGNTNYALNAASSIQTIAHGLGKIPSFVRINSHCGMGSSITMNCSGAYDGSNANYAYNASYPGNSSQVGNGTGYIIAMSYDNGFTDGQKASIMVDATNIYLSWTKVGTPATGTIAYVWEAYG
jgi:hypothetical protein